MPKFTSYGIVDPEIHYHVPRTELIDSTLGQLIGETPEKGGHYITVWAPRQAGKSWALHSTLRRIRVEFMQPKGGNVAPEFPTGNGQIDLLVHHAGQIYGIEVKSFSDSYKYKKALEQTARYAKSMGWTVVWLVFFTEQIDEKNRAKYQVTYRDPQSDAVVEPIFIALGSV